MNNSGVSNNNIKPPLKWAGGKRWLVPYVKEYWDKYKNYRLVEPLCGGLGIGLSILPNKSIMNDVNPHLINFYKQLKKGLKISIEMENNSNVFYEKRREFNDLIVGVTYFL